MSSNNGSPVYGTTLEVSAKAPAGRGPLVLFVKVVGPLVPSIVLRQGDKAQALTLRLLEETQDVVDEHMHSTLQINTTNLEAFRREIKGGDLPNNITHYASTGMAP
ncbi:hypothetical protein DAEQUDRAFT_763586 [Daedalea quercina L-15889]|uniref:Uncharacterized protein n=1 Tax=Daedalea quercina L-15889 TaxID=1314783 RepID=A0A165SAX0_9APHY|nr:hypothetical protein DAEQUDRAFT_763586 [Daedalea quercina L-15889]